MCSFSNLASEVCVVVALLTSSSVCHAQSFGVKIIPAGSSSMVPTFQKTDDIEIDMDAYSRSQPKRWEVVTYLSPVNGMFWTHRIIGVPGDTVSYDRDKKLRINGTLTDLAPLPQANPNDPKAEATVFVETFETERHLIRLLSGQPAVVDNGKGFPESANCKFDQTGFTCTIPAGRIFVMGDNRDMSYDSRYFGFVSLDSVGGRVKNLPERTR